MSAGGPGGEGRLVTFEGTEGTGKSTQVSLLAEALRRGGREVVVTREPGGTVLGEDLRKMVLGLDYRGLSPTAELFLYLADRAQHMAEIIRPALEAGKVVICDRFTDATIAYQGFGRGLDMEFIARLNEGATSGRIPDLTILLDLPDVEEGLRRAGRRDQQKGTAGKEDRFEREALAFHLRVRQGYLSLADEHPGRIRVLPAAMPVEELHRKILALVREYLTA